MLYQSANWDLDIFLCRDDLGMEITGQILSREVAGRSQVLNAVAVLVQNDTFVETAIISASGEFAFVRVNDSDMHLELFVNSVRMKVSFRP